MVSRADSSLALNIADLLIFYDISTVNGIFVSVSVVIAFFVCWAPFHAQRLLAVYLASASPEIQESYFDLYIYLMYASGMLYFISTTINPILYHIMSRKFRKEFKVNIENEFIESSQEIR